MGASNHPDLAFPKSKHGRGRATTAKQRAADELARRLQVYHLVDVRDGFKCRCCGRRGSPRATSLLDRLEHDHIVERSLGGQDESANVCCLCTRCHEKKTQHLIEPEGNPDAGTLIFTMPRALVHEIFKGRRLPAHIRIREDRA